MVVYVYLKALLQCLKLLAHGRMREDRIPESESELEEEQFKSKLCPLRGLARPQRGLHRRGKLSMWRSGTLASSPSSLLSKLGGAGDRFGDSSMDCTNFPV